MLSVLADDDEGEAQLGYTWSMVNGPAGVAFSVNASNAAKSSVATFTKAGMYDLQVEVRDSHDITTSAFLSVEVRAGGLASVTVTGPAELAHGAMGTYTASGTDLAGASVATGPCTWSSTAGTIDMNSGVLTVEQNGTVTATCGTISGSTDVHVTPPVDKIAGCHCGSAEGLLALAALAVFRRRRQGGSRQNFAQS